MPARSSHARWEGDLRGGKGTMRLASGAFEGQYSFSSRFEEGTGTNPEELIGAAHAGCFSMFLANVLAQGGHTPTSVETTATVHLEGGTITRIDLVTEVDVPGVDDAAFQEAAGTAKVGCPVSKALAAVEITLQATRRG